MNNTILEIYRSKDKHVTKYVHVDGTETAIKTTPKQEFGGSYGKVYNKFNIFISSSYGCPVGCKFCYLTTKKCKYIPIDSYNIYNNIKDAVTEEIIERPQLKDMYAKLSWMGMGDVCLNTALLYETSVDILGFLVDNTIVKGIDGIDISTTLPTNDFSIDLIVAVNNYLNLSEYLVPLNPARNYMTNSRSPLRFFYSLHSALDKTRKKLIPNTISIEDAVKHINYLHKHGITVIIHHMFFDGVNDTDEELKALLYFLNKYPIKELELRILRFNACKGTRYKESPKFDSIVEMLYNEHKNIKVQSSPGSEVKAACGQFIISRV